MIYAIKKAGESNERLINRFKKLMQRSRVIVETKKKKNHLPTITKREVRMAAIIRDKHRKRREAEKFAS